MHIYVEMKGQWCGTHCETGRLTDMVTKMKDCELKLSEQFSVWTLVVMVIKSTKNQGFTLALAIKIIP